MITKLKCALILVMGFLGVALPVLGHHSFAAQYDRTKPITLKGTVTKVEWMNPHIYFYIDVTDQADRTDELGC